MLVTQLLSCQVPIGTTRGNMCQMADHPHNTGPTSFRTRGDLLKSLPDAQALFDHSDTNLRTGKSFSDERGLHSVLSITVSDERLNDGKPTLIPSVYDGGALPQPLAIKRAVKSGRTFPSRDSFAEIDRFAANISSLMGDDFADAAERRDQRKRKARR